MTKYELLSELSFLNEDDVIKHISIYVYSNEGLQLFNIDQDNLDELLPLYINVLKGLIFDKAALRYEDYSTTKSRVDTLYRFDLSDELRTSEMIQMIIAGTNQNPPYFTVGTTSVESITGLYVVLKDNGDKRVVLYKKVGAMDRLYARSSYFFGCKHDNSMFERKTDSYLRITPGAQMLYVNGDVVLIDMQKLEKSLGLDAILTKENEAVIQKVQNRSLVADVTNIRNVCTKLSLCKKLKHAIEKSKVKDVENAKIIEFVRDHPELKNKFKFTEDGTKFNLDSKASAERFIKLLDDDYLYSKLSETQYDSDVKDDKIE